MAVPSPPPPPGIDRRICLTRAVRAQLAENEAAARAVKTNKETEGSLLAHRRWETFRQEEHGLRLSDRNSILIT